MVFKNYMRKLTLQAFWLTAFAGMTAVIWAQTVEAEDKPKSEKPAEKSAEKPGDPAAAATENPVEEPVLEPGAEYLCGSEISYVWKQVIAKRDKNSKTGKIQETVEIGEPDTEFFATVGETGQVKSEVAHRLSVKLPSIQDEAMVSCRAVHQNLTGCIGSWLDSSDNEYATLDFELRKKLLASIKDRCDQSFGLCVDTLATPIKCHVSRSPDAKKVDPAEAAADKGKGAAGKDKKAAKKK